MGDRDGDGCVGGHHDGRDEHARNGGARRLLERGADGSLEPIRREELLRRQDAGQDRAVRGKEEPRSCAEQERHDRELRDRDGSEPADDDDRRDRQEVDELDDPDDEPSRDTVGDDPTGDRAQQEAGRVGRGDEGEIERPAARRRSPRRP